MKYQRFGGFMWKIWRDEQTGQWMGVCDSLEVSLEEDTQLALKNAIVEAITLIIGCATKAA